jgi:Transglycosylase SLT domain
MKRILTCALILSAVLLPPILVSKADYEVQGSSATIPIPAQILPVEQSSTLEAWIDGEAQKYGVNPALANCIITHESMWQADRIGDVGNPHGESVGLWQISISQHTDITLKQALSPESSTDWALQKIAAGDVDWWSTVSAKPFYCRSIHVYN